MDYLYIVGTVIFTVYGQVMLKWRIVKHGDLPKDFQSRVSYALDLAKDPFIISVFFAVAVGYICWMVAMTKYEISFAYPFMSLCFILVLISSSVLFNEPITIGKVLGLVFIVIGLIISVKL